MRASLCLIAVCLVVTGCEPSAPTDEQIADSDGESAAVGEELRQTEQIDEPATTRNAEDPEAAAPENPLIALLEQDIPYGEGPNGNLVGFLAVPEDAAEPLPGILVLHEWWGLTEPIREVSRRLAREGYVVLALDLYGGRMAGTAPEAQELLRELVAVPDQVRENIRQGYEYLERYALAPKIGSIGWDLGGRWSLQTALMLPSSLDAAVIFYGAIETDETLLNTLNMPILGFFGEQDASIPLSGVQEFRNVLRRLEKPAEVRIYAGVSHGFFFPGSENYSPIAADDAWLRSVTLLASGLKD